MRSLSHLLDTSGKVSNKIVTSPEVSSLVGKLIKGSTHQRVNIHKFSNQIGGSTQYKAKQGDMHMVAARLDYQRAHS